MGKEVCEEREQGERSTKLGAGGQWGRAHHALEGVRFLLLQRIVIKDKFPGPRWRFPPEFSVFVENDKFSEETAM